MALGLKEVGGDYFGVTDAYDDFDDMAAASYRKPRKRSRKRSKNSRKSSPKRRRSKHRKRTTSSKGTKRKRKGMSKEFLRNLRRKHGLGEFKKK